MLKKKIRKMKNAKQKQLLDNAINKLMQVPEVLRPFEIEKRREIRILSKGIKLSTNIWHDTKEANITDRDRRRNH